MKEKQHQIKLSYKLVFIFKTEQCYRQYLGRNTKGKEKRFQTFMNVDLRVVSFRFLHSGYCCTSLFSSGCLSVLKNIVWYCFKPETLPFHSSSHVSIFDYHSGHWSFLNFYRTHFSHTFRLNHKHKPLIVWHHGTSQMQKANTIRFFFFNKGVKLLPIYCGTSPYFRVDQVWRDEDVRSNIIWISYQTILNHLFCPVFEYQQHFCRILFFCAFLLCFFFCT